MTELKGAQTHVIRLSRWFGGAALVLVSLGFGIRFLDGPFFLFHGGPFRSGDFVDYRDVDWPSLDHHRELELQLRSTERSLRLWFSVTKSRPYISCGFSCEDGLITRWPRLLNDDPRIIVRLDGMRVRARAERVSRDSAEHDEVRAQREAKFSANENSRTKTEQVLHDAIGRTGSRLSDDEETPPSNRLFRIVAP